MTKMATMPVFGKMPILLSNNCVAFGLNLFISTILTRPIQRHAINVRIRSEA